MFHHTSKLQTSQLTYCPADVSKIAGRVADSVDPDQTPRSACQALSVYPKQSHRPVEPINRHVHSSKSKHSRISMSRTSLGP